MTDEIGLLVQDYLGRNREEALALIDDRIAEAVGRGGWSDVLKWQRVKHRFQFRHAQEIHTLN